MTAVEGINKPKSTYKEQPNRFKIFSYFPVRWMFCAAFFTFVFLEFNFLETLEEQTLLHILQFFQVPSYYLDGELFIGTIHGSSQFIIPTSTHTLFLIFFPSIMVATAASWTVRTKFLFYGVLCFVGYIAFQLIIIALMQLAGSNDSIGSFQVNVVFSALIGGLFIELSVLRIITLPKSEKIKPVLKRSYKIEYAYLIILLVVSGLIMFGLFNLMNIKDDGVVSTFIALSFSNILVLKMFISYFGWEIRKPLWTKFKLKNNIKTPTVTFLLPAYNEERTVSKLIRSIDKAASKYAGEVDIVLVNDGSTDRTAEIAEEEMILLKYCKGVVYTIKNMGKGAALVYGLERVTGEVLIRVDADSMVGENVIQHVTRHYSDPTVGSVSGLLFPLKETSIWQKAVVLLGCQNVMMRKEHNLTDSILVQPGAFSTFRTDALRKVGSWIDNQLGEDGEITLRMGRHGYRHVFEEKAVAFSDVPNNFHELREQRLRWSIAFFHSRSKNSSMVKEIRGPRSIMLMLNFLEHGAGYARTLFYPFLAVALFFDDGFSLTNLGAIIGVPTQLILIDLIVFGMIYIVYFRYLYRFRRMHLVNVIPFMRVYFFLISNFIKPESLEILLVFSSKYKYHTKQSQKELVKMIKEKTKMIKPK